MLKPLVTVAALTFAAAAIAQPASPNSEDVIARMDNNADGAISKDEAKGPLAENFDAVDTDKDGKLSQAEMKVRMADRPRPAASGMPSPEQIIGFLDGNADGFIAKDEAQGPLVDYFDMVDADKDAKVSLDELKTAMAAMQPPEE
jgi:EF-hand domain pair/EF hand